MKYLQFFPRLTLYQVALFTRAWIEIRAAQKNFHGACVALFTRAWIEILTAIFVLKTLLVALFTRAWIEIIFFDEIQPENNGRPLYEGVD